MAIKHILWDWNGTLLDDVELCVEATNILLEKNHLPLIDIEFYRWNFTFPINIFYQKTGLNINKNYGALCQLWNDYYMKEFPKRVLLRTGAKELLSKINNLGIGQSILSACELSSLNDSLEYLKLKCYFEGIYGNKDFNAYGKMNLAEQIFKKLDLLDGEVLIIGDTDHDYQIAEKFHASFILLKNGHCDFRRFESLNVQQVEKLDDILPLLNNGC